MSRRHGKIHAKLEKIAPIYFCNPKVIVVSHVYKVDSFGSLTYTFDRLTVTLNHVEPVMTTYGYCRVSTHVQVAEGNSLEVQQDQIEGWCKVKGLGKPVFFVEEGVSGSKPIASRPAGQKLLAALKHGDVIIASKMDRIFRSALDALTMVEKFKKMKVSLHLIDIGGDVSGNGVSTLFFTILSAVAQFERTRIQERQTESHADLRARGRHAGGSRPFGYQVQKVEGELRGGILVEDEAEQAAIEKMKVLKAEGKSLRAISQIMKDDGFKVSHESVAQILAR